jgi:hypothetical protein
MANNNRSILLGLVKMLDMLEHMHKPSVKASSSALKFSINTGPAAFYGEKFKVEKACLN